jgi:hypothetical protein
MPDSTSDRPEDIQFISGVILVSRQAEQMAQFYRDGGDLVSRWSAHLTTGQRFDQD